MVRVRGVVPQNFLQGVLHPLNFCVDLCHLWEALLCKNILCVPCVLWEVFLNQKSAFCGRYFSTRRVSSVGDYSFSMRKRLTMPKTRA